MGIGTWGEWVGAIGGLAAGLIPAVLWFFERRDRRAAEAELRVLRSRSVREQPSRMAAWIDPDGRLKVYNGANRPAFWVQIHDSATDTQWFRSRFIKPGDTLEVPEPFGFPTDGIYMLFRMDGVNWRSEWEGSVFETDAALDYHEPGRTSPWEGTT